jgi:hypothetical protein
MDRNVQRLSAAMKALLAFALVILAAPTSAQVQPGSGGYGGPCPHTTGGWSLSWPPPITSASWDSQTGLLYMVFNYKTAQAFSNVPLGIIQALSQTKNPSSIYSTIMRSYHQILLSEKDNCPLRWEYQGLPEAYIWTD